MRRPGNLMVFPMVGKALFCFLPQNTISLCPFFSRTSFRKVRKKTGFSSERFSGKREVESQRDLLSTSGKFFSWALESKRRLEMMKLLLEGRRPQTMKIIGKNVKNKCV